MIVSLFGPFVLMVSLFSLFLLIVRVRVNGRDLGTADAERVGGRLLPGAGIADDEVVGAFLPEAAGPGEVGLFVLVLNAAAGDL